MKTVYIFLAEGFEEIEAVTPMDVLRRGGIQAKFVSVTGSLQVKGAHGVTYTADMLFSDIDQGVAADGLILPGGMPGTTNLMAHKELCQMLIKYAEAGKYVCAICAAPMVLGSLGLIKGKKAAIYPGMEDMLTGARAVKSSVCIDGNIITSRGPGTAMDFSLALAEVFLGRDTAASLKESLVYQQ